MNQELGEFFVKFTTKGLTELKDALDKIYQKLDEVGDATQKASDSHNKFTSNIDTWIGRIVRLGTVVWALKSAWDGVARVSAETMDIYQQAMYYGTDPQTIERWQRTAERQGLDAKSIAPGFGSIRDFLYDYKWGNISEGFNKELGQALSNVPNKDKIQDAIITSIKTNSIGSILQTLNEWFSSGALGAEEIKRILRAFGIDNTTFYTLLNEASLPQLLQEAPTIFTEDEETLKNAAEFTRAKAELNEAIDEFWVSIQPEITRLIKWFADEGIPAIKDFIDKYWPDIEDGIKGLVEWVMDKLGWLIDWYREKKEKERASQIRKDEESLAANAQMQKSQGLLVPAKEGEEGAKKYLKPIDNGYGHIIGWSNDEYEWLKPVDPLSPSSVIHSGLKWSRILRQRERDAVEGGIPDDRDMWANLAPAEQMDLFTKYVFGPYKQGDAIYYIPSHLKDSNSATAIVNIDGHEVVRNESGNISVLDYTTDIPLSSTR